MKIVVFDKMDQCSEAEVQRMLPLVSAQRREQALRYTHTMGQFCCLKSWIMLRELMEERGGGLMDEWRYNPYGKPYIEGALHFSISHCKEGIAVAVDDQPIGIDIESIRHADEALIKRTMSLAEQQQIHSDRDFTRLWTQKEAVVKMQGTGITSFEQIQKILDIGDCTLDTFEKEKYIYSIAHGKLCSISAEV